MAILADLSLQHGQRNSLFPLPHCCTFNEIPPSPHLNPGFPLLLTAWPSSSPSIFQSGSCPHVREPRDRASLISIHSSSVSSSPLVALPPPSRSPCSHPFVRTPTLIPPTTTPARPKPCRLTLEVFLPANYQVNSCCGQALTSHALLPP